jgi:hypothetical protein
VHAQNSIVMQSTPIGTQDQRQLRAPGAPPGPLRVNSGGDGDLCQAVPPRLADILGESRGDRLGPLPDSCIAVIGSYLITSFEVDEECR